MSTSQTVTWPIRGVPTYSTLSAFPVSPNGSLAVALDSDILYVSNGATWSGVGGAGGVTSVSASSPLFSSGGTTPNLTIQVANTSQNGYLSSTDWNTFNNKFTLPSLTSGSVLFSNGTTISQNNTHFHWDNTNNQLVISGDGSVASPGNSFIQINNTHGTAADECGISFTNTGFTGRCAINSYLDAGGGTAQLIFYTGDGTPVQSLILSSTLGAVFTTAVKVPSLVLNNATTTLTQLAHASTTNYSVTWPSAQGTGALTNDGSGGLSWTAVGGSFLPLAGGTMSGDIDMGTNDISNITGLYDLAGTPLISVSVASRQLVDTTNYPVVDWYQNQLNSSTGGLASLSWYYRRLFDSTGTACSVDWANRVLYDTSGLWGAISWDAAVAISTAAQTAANSDNTTVSTGTVTDTFASGTLTLQTGANSGTEAYSGDLNIKTGNTSGGTVTNSASGNVTISTGQSTSEYTGVISLITGSTSDATKRGEIFIDAKNTAVSRPLKTNASGALLSTQIDLASANDVTGVLPPTNGGAATGSYAQAYHTQACIWATSSGSYADPTPSGTAAITVRQSSGITLTTAGSNLPGVTFTPANASAIYLITAVICLSGGSATSNGSRLTDGTTVIAQGPDLQEAVGVNSTGCVTLSGIFVPGTSSPVTVKVQLSSNGAAALQYAINGNPIEWTVLRIF